VGEEKRRQQRQCRNEERGGEARKGEERPVGHGPHIGPHGEERPVGHEPPHWTHEQCPRSPV
jgi:hypothetical protein